MFDRLGAIEWVKVEDTEPGPRVEEPPAAAAAQPTGRSPFPRAADIDPGLAAAYRCVVDIPAATPPIAPVIPDIVQFDPTAGIVWPPSILDRLERIRSAEIAAASRQSRQP